MILIYELQNNYMTQGLYSFSEARHESNGRSIVRYKQSGTRARQEERGVQGFMDLRTGVGQQEHIRQ